MLSGYVNRSAISRMPTCKKGYIRRSSYTRKGVRVPAGCIRGTSPNGTKYANFQAKQGLKTRRKNQIGPIKKGLLTKFGYVDVASLSQQKRRAALKKAVDAYGSLSTWKKINVLSVFTKKRNPKLRGIYNADKDWIKRTFGLRAF